MSKFQIHPLGHKEFFLLLYKTPCVGKALSNRKACGQGDTVLDPFLSISVFRLT